MNYSNALTISIFLMILFTSSLFAASSPVFRCNAQRTGVQQETAEPVLTPVWQFNDGGSFLSSPVVYKDIVYCGGRDLSVWAWDAATGAVRWHYATNGWVDATPCVANDTVFVPCRDRTIYAFDRLSGDIRWQTSTGSADCSSPVYNDGKIYLLSGSPERKVYCLDANTGSMLHTYPLTQCGFSSPALQGTRLCFGTNDGRITCLDLQTGAELWSKGTRGGILYSCVAISSQTVYAVSGGDERRLFAYDLESGAPRWQSVEIDSVTSTVSSVAVGDQGIYLVSTFNDNENQLSELYLLGFDLAGNQRWKTHIGWPHNSDVISSPVVVGNIVYVGSGDGNLYAVNAAVSGPDQGKYVNPATGALTTSATGYFLCTDPQQTPAVVSSPAVANGKLYIGAFDGTFWCLDAARKVHIASPDTDDAVVNSAAISGSVAGYGPGYTLEYGQGAAPGAWTPIVASTAAVQDGTLGEWQTSALADGRYTLRLTANAGAAYTAKNSVIVDNSPRIPATLTARDTPFDGGGSITLDWALSADDGSGTNDVTGYRVYRSTYNGGYALLGQAAQGVATYADTGAALQTTYYYVITAIDAHSESGYSNSVNAVSIVDGVKITPENGGTVTMVQDGLATEVVFEPGTVRQTVYVGIRIPDAVPAVVNAPEMVPTAVAREFGMTPADAALLKPVTIKLPYTDAQAHGMQKDNLRIYWWDAQKSLWRIVNTSTPRAEKNRVWAAIPHFSLYRIMEYVPGREFLINEERVYSYPNPAKGDTLYFKYYLGDTADVTIDIYNVAGELIAHLEQRDNMAGIVSEIPWDCGPIASGVYIYRVQAKSASQTRDVKKKLAIIH